VNQPLNRQNPQETPSLEEKILSNLDSCSGEEGRMKIHPYGSLVIQFQISNF